MRADRFRTAYDHSMALQGYPFSCFICDLFIFSFSGWRLAVGIPFF